MEEIRGSYTPNSTSLPSLSKKQNSDTLRKTKYENKDFKNTFLHVGLAISILYFRFQN